MQQKHENKNEINHNTIIVLMLTGLRTRVNLIFESTSSKRITEGVIKNGQSRDTGNIGYTRHMTKTNKTKNTTHKTKELSNTDPHQKSGGEPNCSLRVS
jgi:hypothetical protein